MSIEALRSKARHVVVPDGIVSTEWPSICGICSELGITFDDWQDGLGRLILAKRADGLYASDTTAISIPRQSGKTFLIGAIVFALCIKNPGLRVIWTAHLFKTARETFESLQAVADMPNVRPHIANIYRGAGDEKIVFANGSKIMFGARERGFGRGFPNIGVLVFDEAQILTSKALDDMVPSTNVHKNPLILTMGTPPKPEDPSEFFAAMRGDALNPEPETLRESLYVEFSADRGCDPGDKAQWVKAIPAYPKRVGERAVRRMRKLLGELSFLREGLGIWDDLAIARPPISVALWRELAGIGPDDDVAPDALAVDQSHYGDISVSAAWVDGEDVHVEEVWAGIDTAAAVRWIAERAGRRMPVIIDSASPAAGLIPELLAFRVNVRQTSAQDMAKACGLIANKAANFELTHANQDALNTAVEGSLQRPIRDAGGWGWDRRDPTVPIYPLVSATLAVYGATSYARRKRQAARSAMVLT
ncbi:DEAD/DEAH box helicase family protein [Mycobacteroides abscessus]|uniref:terminase n=1 Tax=Mycobacteroides abscessus TaxID=36809 RepID=UPI00092A54E9|nr:terminase [Mycobacteroides abscessus]SKS05247.1 gp8 domain protein [Mycobacteroides abscessus subsp. abscessus]SHU54204.1 gp8 domain protein [Mycobacteroides abscessus subsp. bolletii]SHW62855.1 gp8 domain protein [Mycobacteroides abscessus subsp. bolletii]SHW90860.1 gp8 domain protein [Mycobacteroides abscessus subsp. bolletii]SHX34469.1 gp8 domain protein [Mycobacteroides abscessus subsp. bolletii]